MNPYRKTPARFSDPEAHSSAQLLCPECGHHYTHQGKPHKAFGYDRLPHSCADLLLRGDGVRIPFACENGHVFNLIIGQHKGNTLLYCELDVPVLDEEQRMWVSNTKEPAHG